MVGPSPYKYASFAELRAVQGPPGSFCRSCHRFVPLGRWLDRATAGRPSFAECQRLVYPRGRALTYRARGTMPDRCLAAADRGDQIRPMPEKPTLIEYLAAALLGVLTAVLLNYGVPL